MPRWRAPSLLLSLDDEPWRPSQRLYSLAADLAGLVPRIVHRTLATRSSSDTHWFEVFPGEHYHLLTALSVLCSPRIIWEFGTFTGMSAVALLEGNPLAELTTVDIDPWRSKAGTWFIEEDFDSGRVCQLVSDMTSPALFEEHGDRLAMAELIFVDGPKDGTTEPRLLELLAEVPFSRDPLVVFDDIREMNMVEVWRGIARPKMDLTSYGHFTGTGIVDWCGTL
jgi:predicted O-methyltransferase YrrM